MGNKKAFTQTTASIEFAEKGSCAASARSNKLALVSHAPTSHRRGQWTERGKSAAAGSGLDTRPASDFDARIEMLESSALERIFERLRYAASARLSQFSARSSNISRISVRTSSSNVLRAKRGLCEQLETIADIVALARRCRYEIDAVNSTRRGALICHRVPLRCARIMISRGEKRHFAVAAPAREARSRA